MKSIWEGVISFGLVNIPVSVLPAVRSHEISFHFLHERDLGRIHNERVCDACGRVVPYSEVVKGYEYGEDKIIPITPEDFEGVKPEAAKAIQISDFVSAPDIDPLYYDRTYYLSPDKKGEKAYALLREALKRTQRAGIATLVLRTRENLAAVTAKGDFLLLNILHFAHEIQRPAPLALPAASVKLGSKELELAQKLVESMSSDFKPEKYKDTYEDDLLELIAQKARGRAPRKLAAPKPATNVIDIMSKLKASLQQSKRPTRRKTA